MQPESAVEIEVRPPAAPRFAALIHCRGEHDLASGPKISEALATIHGNVLLDLSRCTFIDSTVIGILLRDAQQRKREGYTLELVVPRENRTIAHTLALVGAERTLAVHDSVEHA
jgi:anti-anti-sigma factor